MVNLVVWNQLDRHVTFTLRVGDEVVYDGTLGISNMFPKIVMQQGLVLAPGEQTIHVAIDGVDQAFTFVVKPNTNLHIDAFGHRISATYGFEGYE